MTARRLAAVLLALWGMAAALAHLNPARAECATEDHEGRSYDVCRFDPAEHPLELFNLDEQGTPIGNFSALATRLAGDGKRLTFAMNAGMFDDKLHPIGLYVERGQTLKKLNRRNGFGNFHLKPNGVFLIEDGKAAVMETDAFARAGLKPDFATQSGPMLVINGKLHPKFSVTGTSAKIRTAWVSRRQAKSSSCSPKAPSPSTSSPASSATRWARPMRSSSTARSRASTPPTSAATTASCRSDPWSPFTKTSDAWNGVFDFAASKV